MTEVLRLQARPEACAQDMKRPALFWPISIISVTGDCRKEPFA
jgi:hypothetical protein